MARVFVSHSSTDPALAAEVHRWLVDDGHEAFLDQDLYDGIRVGDKWERREYSSSAIEKRGFKLLLVHM